MSEKSYVDLTSEELDKRAKLTPKEQEAVDRFIYAARLLPRSICVEVDDNWDGEGHLKISKRIALGCCQQVIEMRADPRTAVDLEPVYGVSRRTIRQIRRRERWTHI